MVHSLLVGKGRKRGTKLMSRGHSCFLACRRARASSRSLFPSLACSIAHSRLPELNNSRFKLHFTQTRCKGSGKRWALSSIAPRAVRGRKGAERISQPCAEVINIYKYFNRSILLQALAESFYRMRLSALLLLLLLLLLCLQQLRQQQKASTPLLMPLHPKHSENRANHCF